MGVHHRQTDQTKTQKLGEGSCVTQRLVLTTGQFMGKIQKFSAIK